MIMSSEMPAIEMVSTAAGISAAEQQLVPNETTHTAYVHPGHYIDALRLETVGVLQRALPDMLRRESGYF